MRHRGRQADKIFKILRLAEPAGAVERGWESRGVGAAALIPPVACQRALASRGGETLLNINKINNINNINYTNHHKTWLNINEP